MTGAPGDRAKTTMAIVKCPYCNRRFTAVHESRDHIQAVHPDGVLA